MHPADLNSAHRGCKTAVTLGISSVLLHNYDRLSARIFIEIGRMRISGGA